MPGGLVNLDALIPRGDLAYDVSKPARPDSFSALKTHDLIKGGSMLFRKPDFQRETSHWSPDKIRDLVLAFVNEDLVPSVILWRSARNEAFVIDGAHRLSSLIAWVNDDYGDGDISKAFFGDGILEQQRKAADKAKELVNKAVGRYADIADSHRDNRYEQYRELATRLNYCALQVQTLPGDADKAENSFFRINKQGVKLDNTELTLLYSRNCPNAVAARAINQNGTGHPHWKQFTDHKDDIEKHAKRIHQLFFVPELTSAVVKTTEVPTAGRKNYPEVLSMLLNTVNLANQIAGTVPSNKSHAEQLVSPDVDGSQTVKMLENVKRIAERIESDRPGSLGLNPFVYFYSLGGRHLPSSFLAIFELFSSIDKADGFAEFTRVRAAFEDFLVAHSEFIPQITRKARGELRGVNALKKFFSTVIEELQKPNASVDAARTSLLNSPEYGYLKAHAYENTEYGEDFSAEVKSGITIKHHLATAIRCDICHARIAYGAISVDHRTDKKYAGDGTPQNAGPTHRYCNSAKDSLTNYFDSHGGVLSYRINLTSNTEPDSQTPDPPPHLSTANSPATTPHTP